MNKIILTMKSRTFWTIVGMVVLNTIEANTQFIPAGVMNVLNPVLGALAAYLHANPRFPTQSASNPSDSESV